MYEGYIDSVIVGSIVNTETGCGNYVDYTSMSTTIEKGQGVPIIVINSEYYYVEDWCGVWVDWNQDEDFNDADETISIDSSDYQIFTGTIAPPANALIGDTRMRVRIRYTGPGGGALEPCGTTDLGEVEDYTIIVANYSAAIQGVKFHDFNGNGVRDDGEPGVEGWQIYIDLNNNERHDAGEPLSVTGSSGDYEFTALAANTYIVAEVPLEDWVQTCPGGDGRYEVDVGVSEIIEGVDFGNYLLGCGSALGGLDGDKDVDFDDILILCEQWLMERLSADIVPDCPDGVVDFSDWAAFVGAWQSTPSSPRWNVKCDISPQGGNEIIDWNDLAVLFDQWLMVGAYCADIAPLPDGDGVVDGFDFAALAQNWLDGF